MDDGTNLGPHTSTSQPIVEPVPFPLEASIPELQSAMEAGELTSVELVDFYLARIAAYDDAGPELNAFITVNPAARDEAAALDAERTATGSRGPLHGIPVVVKDNIGTADMPTTAGSVALEGFVPAQDAFQVRRLREAGAIILGKANLFEFALRWESLSSLGGQTRNPYDPARDPGGSSGGTAVAVAANLAAVGLGTDTCGSIRLPSAHNDLYGLRPSSGLSSRAGVIPFSTTLDTVGPMSRDVIDLAIVLDATVGVDPADPSTVGVPPPSYVDAVDPNGLEGRRIGLVNFTVGLQQEELIAQAMDEIEANGAVVVDVKIPHVPNMSPLFLEFEAALNGYLAAQPESPVRSLDDILTMDIQGRTGRRLRSFDVATGLTTSPRHHKAVRGRGSFRDAVVELMDEHDLDAIAYPSSRGIARPVGKSQNAYDCWSAAYAGAPAITIPAGFTSRGLPVGLELMGVPFDERTLIAIAAGYEAHTDHRLLPPATPPL
jgi:Asp-tRNA(Asn)/Glu-tRNA(Gln) amidotransferase A subunit family amidase